MPNLPILHNQSALALAQDLEAAGLLTATGLNREKLPDLSYDQLTSLVSFFTHLGEVSLWGLYDTLLVIEMSHSDLVEQAAEITGRQPQTIENNLSIARRVPRSRRRRELHFSTHAEVASLEPNQQKHWLKVAVEERLTKTELRSRIQAQRDGQSHVLPPEAPEVCESCGRPL
jgi:hypothetical protein